MKAFQPNDLENTMRHNHQPATHVPQEQKSHGPTEDHVEEAARQRERAEVEEVAGRHKEDGQKDHKGAR